LAKTVNIKLPLLFMSDYLISALVLDWVMKKSLSGLNAGLEWVENNRLRDLDFADDIVLITQFTKKHAADDHNN